MLKRFRLNPRHKKTAWQGGLFNNISRSIMHIHYDASNTAVASGFCDAPNLSRQVVGGEP